MSYFQPLITSAFSTYTVSKSDYSDRSVSGTANGENGTVASLSGSETIRNVAPTGSTEKVYGTNDVRGGEKSQDTTVDRDAGKPRSESGDVLDLSQEAKSVYEIKSELNRQADEAAEKQTETISSSKGEQASDDSIELTTPTAEESDSGESSVPGNSELTPEEQEQLAELKARDTEVRIHEQTHVSAGGQYVTGGPSYTYQTGPDGNKYAIGGEVGIDTSEVSGDPEATIRKMQTVAQAALAPAEPSGQDYKVAAAARQKEAQARAELAQQKSSELSGGGNSTEAENSQNKAIDGELSETAETQNAVDTTNVQAASETAKSFIQSVSNLSRNGAAYQAQSSMALNTTANQPRFSAFA